MDVSGEVADLMLKESIEATEKTVRLTASGIKNVAALLIALAKSDRQIIGKTSVRKLTKDPAPAVVLPLKSEDIGRFSKLAKQYGVTYIIARPKGKGGGDVDIISNQNYAPQLNALYQAMGYPLPEQNAQAKEDAAKEDNAKKAQPRVPQEKSSPERGNGSTVSRMSQTTRTTDTAEKISDIPTVKGRLAVLQKTAAGMRDGQAKQRSQPTQQKSR